LELTQEERARITDSAHKIQSANGSLARVDPTKIPEIDEIQDCLENADKTLRGVLRSPQERSIKPPEPDKRKPS
jgi:hypothetical protein